MIYVRSQYLMFKTYTNNEIILSDIVMCHYYKQVEDKTSYHIF